MKKNLIVIALALLIALPIIGLAAETATLPETTQTSPLGGQFGRHNNQTNKQVARQSAYVDENNDGVCDVCGNVSGTNTQTPGFADLNCDGVCDTCGNVQGTNAQAPGFIDANGDGVCDNMGTGQQY